MVEEYGVHGFADGIVAPERKGKVGDAAGAEGARKIALDPAHRFYEIYAVAGVFGYARAHGQHVDVKYYVAAPETQLFGEQPVCAGANLYLSSVIRGLSLLVEGHHYHGCTQSLDFPCLEQECLLSFLEGDGVHDALSLGVFQACEYGVPVG